MSDTPRPWGYMRGETFIRLPKQPMLLAGLGPPPFDVELPTGRMRHVIEEPGETNAQVGAQGNV